MPLGAKLKVTMRRGLNIEKLTHILGGVGRRHVVEGLFLFRDAEVASFSRVVSTASRLQKIRVLRQIPPPPASTNSEESWEESNR